MVLAKLSKREMAHNGNANAWTQALGRAEIAFMPNLLRLTSLSFGTIHQRAKLIGGTDKWPITT